MTPQEQAQKYINDNNIPIHYIHDIRRMLHAAVADDFVAGHAAANEWVSVADGLPLPECPDVEIVYDGVVSTGYYEGEKAKPTWYDFKTNRRQNVTHWRWMPAPPDVP